MKIYKRELGIEGEIISVEVQNMTSKRGNIVPNQYEVIVHTKGAVYNCFYSYNSFILSYKNGIIDRVGKNYNYSRTTDRYRNMFTEMTLKDLESCMKNKNFIYDETLQVYKK